jgi:hypothetical protein
MEKFPDAIISELEEQVPELREILFAHFEGDYSKVCEFAARFLILATNQARELEDALAREQEVAEMLVKSASAHRNTLDFFDSAQRELLVTARKAMMDSLLRGVALGKSALPRRNAKKRHEEHYQMKAEIFEWLDKNPIPYRGKDATAQRIMKIVPIAFRTARNWIDDWEEVRSAGRQ